MDLIFRTLAPSEAKAASELESECLHTAWSEEQINSLPSYALYLGAFSGDTLCGVASAYIIADEVQVMNLAVSPKYRRMGIALGLMEEIIKAGKEKGCCNISLEVAENNPNAISLYEKCGFSAVGRRKGFYGDIAAVIMEKIL